ncbi:Uncharacterised protein [Mycobacteroides abscessus subsp. abscessus]|nr:Uncharacterised protein [Mycobacteroides abscessus subsp. abscessus]
MTWRPEAEYWAGCGAYSPRAARGRLHGGYASSKALKNCAVSRNRQ